MDTNNFPKLDEVVRKHVLTAVEAAGGSKAKAAELLGVSVKTVYNHMHRYNLENNNSSSSESVVESQNTESVVSTQAESSESVVLSSGSSSIFG